MSDTVPQSLAFVKWEGLGNDFVILRSPPPEAATCALWARSMCHRHKGIGADGLAFLTPEPGMVIYNSDGSLARMCGNALRCLGAIAVQAGMLELGRETLFQTASGPRAVTVHSREPWWVEVDMGQPSLSGTTHFAFEGRDLTVHLASMGNPHAVVLQPELPREDWEECARRMQRANFAETDGINIEFVNLSRDGAGLEAWVHERGAGPTQACGTGASAAFAVAHQQGLIGSQGWVALPGGSLEMHMSKGGSVKRRGPAREVFRGEWTAS